ncbi:AraC family transcriptional regulator ligand-binding domain-containing protein [Ruegeria meonggei]|uniref:AraC family transcriptional regulator ligand-binding domain-containing protein n=1 Tax=Ruegeria meonggei TaxID=1446476 RepID=UPI00366ED522
MPTNLSTRSRDEHPVHYLVVALHKLGVSEGDICERLQLDKTRLFDPDAVSSAENYLNLFEWAARQLGDASLGLHITEVAEPRQFGLSARNWGQTGDQSPAASPFQSPKI